MSVSLTINSNLFESWFETIDGKELVNIKRLAEAFDKPVFKCIEIIQNGPKIFKGERFEFTPLNGEKSESAPNGKRGRGRPQKDHYLTRNGCLAFVNRLDYNRHDDIISNFIITFQRWLIQTAGKVIDKEIVPVNSLKLNYLEQRIAASDNHKLLMAAVKRYEAPKFPQKSHEPYQRESRAVNEDAVGVHIKDLNNKLNPVGLRIKNDAYNSRRALVMAGVEFETRNRIVRTCLNESYPRRDIGDMLLTSEQKERITRKLPESQKGLSEFSLLAEA